MNDDITSPGSTESAGGTESSGTPVAAGIAGAEDARPVPVAVAPIAPDDLFAAPELRPMPDELAARIEAEIAAAASDSANGAHGVPGRRSNRWIAPLVAASLVAVVAGGVAATQHGGHAVPAGPASSSVPSPKATSSITPDADQAALLAKCAEGVGGDAADGVWQKGGDIVLSHDATHANLCAPDGESITDGPGHSLPELVQAFTLQNGYAAFAAGGELPAGVTSVTIDNQDAVVNDGWWLWQRRLPQSAAEKEPRAREIFFNHGKGQASDVRLVAWPGGATGILGLTGRAAVAACQADHESSWAALAPDQRTVLLMTRQGGSTLCHQDSAFMSGPANPVPVDGSTSGLSEATNAYITAATGAVPNGATAVVVSSTLGEERATVSHGRWVWAHTVPILDAGFMPVSYTVSFPGSAEAPRSIPGQQWNADQVDPGFPIGLSGDDLQQHCVLPGNAPGTSVTSSGGHVMVMRQKSNGMDVVTECGDPAAGVVSYKEARADVSAEAFATNLLMPSPGGAGLVTAGGALPKGVTSIVYQTPSGPVPATIKGDLFVYEQFVSSATVATPMPTAVVVTVNGQQRTIRL